MNFRTPINVEKLKQQVSYKKPVVMMGSCFTDNVGKYLKKYLFDVVVNPFGVIYNPLSVKKGIEQLLYREEYKKKDLRFYNELWFSFDHYTLYSDTNKEEALRKINADFLLAKEKLLSAGFLIITFGTSFAYRFKETDELVCNCHKIPSSKFDRFMISPKSIITEYENLLNQLLKMNPDLQVIFTVSPVRHLKDGLIENQRSKAALLLSISELIQLFPGSCHYFPSYEIMMDDLRDYRFYDADLVHPNENAITYIWEKFMKAIIDSEAQGIIEKIDPLLKSRQHKPMHTNTDAYKKFSDQLTKKELDLRNIYPFLRWDKLL